MIKENSMCLRQLNTFSFNDPYSDQWSSNDNARKHDNFSPNYGGMQMNQEMSLYVLVSHVKSSNKERRTLYDSIFLIMFSTSMLVRFTPCKMSDVCQMDFRLVKKTSIHMLTQAILDHSFVFYTQIPHQNEASISGVFVSLCG